MHRTAALALTRTVRVLLVLFVVLGSATTALAQTGDDWVPVPIARSEREVLVRAACLEKEFTFVLGLSEVLRNANNQRRFEPGHYAWFHLTHIRQNREPVTNADPQVQAASQAHADSIRHACAPHPDYVLRNAEQEEIYIRAANRIVFLLDGTYIATRKRCLHHVRESLEGNFRCQTLVDADWQDNRESPMASMLWEGKHKLSFTAFELWRMFRDEKLRDKVEFWVHAPAVHDPAGPPVLQRLNLAPDGNFTLGDPTGQQPWRFENLLANHALALHNFWRDAFKGRVVIQETTNDPR